jgi:hypothetical protein
MGLCENGGCRIKGGKIQVPFVLASGLENYATIEQ